MRRRLWVGLLLLVVVALAGAGVALRERRLHRDELAARLGPPSVEGDRRLEWFLGERESGDSMMFPYREHLGVLLDERGVCVRAAVSTRD